MRGLLALAAIVLLILAAIAALIVASFSEKPQNACPNVEPYVTPSEVLATACPAPTPTPEYGIVMQAEQPVPNAYLRAAPQGQDAPGWFELALPEGRWLVHSSDCALNAWTEVWYHSSAPNLAGINDCPLDAWIPQSTAPCAMDERGACDLTLDQSYQDWLGGGGP